MLFEVGETVVYPHHGAATIIEVKDRVIKGETKRYLKLNVTQGDLIIEVPADNVDLVGVRDVIGREGLRGGGFAHHRALAVGPPLEREPLAFGGMGHGRERQRDVPPSPSRSRTIAPSANGSFRLCLRLGSGL